MSILTDTDLKKILCYDEAQWNDTKTLLIQDGSDQFLTPMGYDLRVGGFCKTFVIEPNLVLLSEGKKVQIKPGDIALIGTLEKLKMPQNGSISALILSKVSQVSRGLSNTSTKVDPGWAEGELLVPVQNFSRDPIELQYGEAFCTIVFFKNESEGSLYKSTGRQKFVKLLAQTRNKSLWNDLVIGLTSPIIILALVTTAYVFCKDSPGMFAGLVAASIAIAKGVSELVSKIIGRS